MLTWNYKNMNREMEFKIKWTNFNYTDNAIIYHNFFTEILPSWVYKSILKIVNTLGNEKSSKSRNNKILSDLNVITL